MSDKNRTFLIIDGNNILFRAYYGIPLLKTTEGRYTNAVFGFLKMLRKVEGELKPDKVAICFDKGKQTFRHQKYPQYKGQRKELDPELIEQFPLIRQVLTANGYYWTESDTYEADDLMGTIATEAVKKGYEVVLFSGDKDLLQLINPHLRVLAGRQKMMDFDFIDEEAFRSKYGLEPVQLIDLKALMGDSSDNYPGIVGVGEKTAIKLLSQYHTVENLYENIWELPPNKLKEKIRNGKDDAFLSRFLATIVTDAPISWEEEQYTPGKKDYQRLTALYKDLEFHSYLSELKKEMAKSTCYGNSNEPSAEPSFVLTRVPALSELRGDDGYAVLLWENTLYIADNFCRCYQTSLADIPSDVKEFMSDDTLTKVTYGYKNLCHLALNEGIAVQGVVDDVVLQAYLLQSDMAAYPLTGLVFNYLKIDTTLFAGDEVLANVCCLVKLAGKLREILEKQNQLHLYTDVELPLVQVLADMEHTGIRVTKETLAEMSRELGEEIQTLEKQIYDEAGETFNINSPKQLSYILFEKLKLPAGKKNQSGYSTNSDVLEKLSGDYSICRKILDYRTVTKFKSTYTDALGKVINPHTGRIHTKFLQTITSTGRLSSAEPNLQNIPVRLEQGRKIRKAFTASDEHHILLSADYSQIELRLLAHFAGDPVLIQAFCDGEDIHARTAGDIFGKTPEEITKDMRRVAKVVNFGIIYGMSSYGLGNDLGISRKEAEEYINTYFIRYPKVQEYQKNAIEVATKCGYAETLFHRRRYLPDLNNKNFNLRSFAQRNAMNMPLQGTAADIIKIAMIRLDNALKEQNLKSGIILQVHDELILDCPEKEFQRVKELLKDTMENVVELSVPLTVECKAGYNWYELKTI